MGIPIKASDFYSKPTLKFLEERFKVNESKKESHKSYVRNVIREAFINEKIISPEQLAIRLKRKGIRMFLRTSKDGELYGITYVHHIKHCVFNGSSLGKQYSAKGILDRCEPIIPYYVKHCQKLISIRDENAQKLETILSSKTNPIDLLLRSENITNYLPHQLKPKKKKIRRRI